MFKTIYSYFLVFPKFQKKNYEVPQIMFFVGVLFGSLDLLPCKIWSLQLKNGRVMAISLFFSSLGFFEAIKLFFAGIHAGSLDLIPYKIWSLQLKTWPSYGHFLDFPKFEIFLGSPQVQKRTLIIIHTLVVYPQLIIQAKLFLFVVQKFGQ